jgi:hypothetical protein
LHAPRSGHLPLLQRLVGTRCGRRALRHGDLPLGRRCGWPRHADDLRGGSACVQRRTRWDEESAGGGGGVPSVGATARVWRIWRCPDDGGRVGGRWNRVGRGWKGAGGRVHRRNCAGGHTEAGIWRWGGEARERNILVGFLRVRVGVTPRVVAGVQSIPPRIVQNAPHPKFFTAPCSLQRLLKEHFVPLNRRLI